MPQWLDEPWSKASEIQQDFSLADTAIAHLTNIFLTRTAQEWEDLINEAGPPTVRCLDSAEWLHEPHAREAEIIVELDDPELGPMLQPGIQVRMGGTPGEIRGPRQALDADREDILAELSATVPAAMRAPGERLSKALEGMTALDLCIILAGPTCGRTLAEFGADVVKIDNPSRENGIMLHEDINRGKRSVLLDLKRAEGRDVFLEMAADVDVVVQNYRQGKVGGLGVDYESVRQINPDVIYASLNAFVEIGPWAERAGWEQLAQSASGMMTRYGDTSPTLQPFAINDYGTGNQRCVRGRHGVVPQAADRGGTAGLHGARANRRHAAVEHVARATRASAGMSRPARTPSAMVRCTGSTKLPTAGCSSAPGRISPMTCPALRSSRPEPWPSGSRS